MFTSLRKIALQNRNLLYFINYPCLIRFISTKSTTNHNNSFTISYLINSCGLSQQKAISASKKVHFDSPTNPDSVLTLLRDNGFSDFYISKITAGYPRLLAYNVDKTLKPKFDFFNGKGLSGEDLAKILSRQANVLSSSLEKTIIPTYEFLKSIVGTDAKVNAMLQRSMNVVVQSKERIASNIALLRSHDVSDSNITKLVVSQPLVILRNPSRLSEMVEEVKKMKFDPSQFKFLVAVHALNSMSRSTFEAKIDVYKSWGWSEHEVQSAFRKQPICMNLSGKNIMSTMDCIVNKFGYAPSSVAEQPYVLMLSCEKRIIPRCLAMQILFENGKVKQSATLYSFLQLREDVFFQKYIGRFGKEVPELLTTYQGKGIMNG